MSVLSVAVAVFATSVPTQTLGPVEKDLCPAILSRPSLGPVTSGTDVAALYEAWRPESGWGREFESSKATASLRPSSLRHLRIRVTEEGSGETDASELLDIDCPVPAQWELVEQPKVEVAFPEKVVNYDIVNAFQLEHGVQGFAFRREPLFKTGLQIWPLWRLLETKTQGSFELPGYVPTEKVTISRGVLKKDAPAAVRAIRMSAEADIGSQTLWHLVLESDAQGPCTHFAVDSADSSYFALEQAPATDVACQLELLTYWNAAAGGLVDCLANAQFEDPNHCAAVNMRRYAGILERIQKDQPFYVQLLVKTGVGFVLPTYRVEKSGITLVEQANVNAPTELGLPTQLNW